MIEKISIIIPALNEELNILNCLNSVFQQDQSLIEEVIIADGGSTDKTLELAGKFNVKIVNGGLPGVARNNGANAAAGDYFLFLDADTILPPGFLNNAFYYFEKKKLGVATFHLTPSSGGFISRLILTIYNAISTIASPLRIGFLTAGCCILVKRSIHFGVNGFSNLRVVLEEYDYIQRIKKTSKFRVIPLKVTTSTRRFKGGKWIRQTLILFVYYFKWIFTGKLTTDRYNYWAQ